MPEEGEPNWFARWEEELPTPEELMPLSQTLITPHLALAFDIPTTPSSAPVAAAGFQAPPPPPATVQPLQTHLPFHQDNHLPPPSGSYDSPELATAAAGGSADEPARTLKRPRLVWTPQLHKRFVDAVAHLGIRNAVPKTIMQLMNVDGLTRENVASHLQKYRLYLKRMEGLSSSAVAGGGGPVSASDECLFASAPLPQQFLSRGPPAAAVPRGAGGDQFMPFVQVASLHHRQQQMAATTAAHQQQLQYYHHRHMGHHMGSTPGGGFEHGYLARRQQQQQQQAGIQRMVGQGGARMVNSPLTGSYGEDLDVGAGTEVGRRKVMTLFPTGDD